MSDFGKRGNSNTMYWRIASGHMVRSAKKETPDAVEVKTPKGDVVYQLHDDYLDGRIVGFEERIADLGDVKRRMLVVIMQGASSMTHRIDMKRGDRYWSNFIKRLPNVNFDQPVRLWPYLIEDDGKTNIGVGIQQNGNKVEQAFTKENPGKLPQPAPETDEDTGEIKYNWIAHNRFLEDVVLVEAQARLDAMAPVTDGVGAVPVDVPDTEDFDDLPWKQPTQP